MDNTLIRYEVRITDSQGTFTYKECPTVKKAQKTLKKLQKDDMPNSFYKIVAIIEIEIT